MKICKMLFWAVTALFIGATVSNAAIINVTPGGTNLQDAIDAANPGDVLVLSAGTFTEEVRLAAPRTAPIQLTAPAVSVTL